MKNDLHSLINLVLLFSFQQHLLQRNTLISLKNQTCYPPPIPAFKLEICVLVETHQGIGKSWTFYIPCSLIKAKAFRFNRLNNFCFLIFIFYQKITEFVFLFVSVLWIFSTSAKNCLFSEKLLFAGWCCDLMCSFLDYGELSFDQWISKLSCDHYFLKSFRDTK